MIWVGYHRARSLQWEILSWLWALLFANLILLSSFFLLSLSSSISNFRISILRWVTYDIQNISSVIQRRLITLSFKVNYFLLLFLVKDLNWSIGRCCIASFIFQIKLSNQINIRFLILNVGCFVIHLELNDLVWGQRLLFILVFVRINLKITFWHLGLLRILFRVLVDCGSLFLYHKLLSHLSIKSLGYIVSQGFIGTSVC